MNPGPMTPLPWWHEDVCVISPEHERENIDAASAEDLLDAYDAMLEPQRRAAPRMAWDLVVAALAIAGLAVIAHVARTYGV
jgi:hypothetical protein